MTTLQFKSSVIAVALLAGLLAALPALAQSAPKGGKGMGRGAGPGAGPGAGLGPGAGPGSIDDDMLDMGPRGSVQNALKYELYPLGLVRRHVRDLSLTEKQTEKLRKLSTDARAEMEKISWDLDREGQKLVDLVKAGAPKKKIEAQLDKVLKHENAVKKNHLRLLIDIRDILTPEQKKKLDTIKAEYEKSGRGYWGRGRGPGQGPGFGQGPGYGRGR